MKLSKALLGAMLVGITAQATGCAKKDDPTPKGEKISKNAAEPKAPPINCPACGLG